ncbi:hypothetical protein L6258_00925, partial [Candidatus Parcubacteria bacterium]|nr:hypothetical protein [Candidatus Parcubacteria bacterium]
FLLILLFFPVGWVSLVRAEEGEILPEAARVGAGIGIGRIRIGQELTPGGIYPLPKIPVVNTGTEGGTYEMGLSYLEGQGEVRPDETWVEFEPRRLHLEAGEMRHIEASLRLPTNARPGDYFSLLEVRRVPPEGKVRVGPAAAAKFYFSVRASSVLGAYRARFLTFIETNSIIYLILAVFLLIEAGLILRRHFRIKVEVRRGG